MMAKPNYLPKASSLNIGLFKVFIQVMEKSEQMFWPTQCHQIECKDFDIWIFEERNSVHNILPLTSPQFMLFLHAEYIHLIPTASTILTHSGPTKDSTTNSHLISLNQIWVNLEIWLIIRQDSSPAVNLWNQMGYMLPRYSSGRT